MSDDVVRTVDRALRKMASAGVRTGSRAIDECDVPRLFPVETAAVERAVARRRHEFATGRVLLRQLLGIDEAIPVRADRLPQLPEGVVGSLAHDADLAVAAVSSEATISAIGIDIEPATPLDEDIAAVVLRDDEAGLDAHLAFTLKEAIYKAWSAAGGTPLDHRDVRVALGNGRFLGEVVGRAARFDGRYAIAAGRWLALVVVHDRTVT